MNLADFEIHSDRLQKNEYFFLFEHIINRTNATKIISHRFLRIAGILCAIFFYLVLIMIFQELKSMVMKFYDCNQPENIWTELGTEKEHNEWSLTIRHSPLLEYVGAKECFIPSLRIFVCCWMTYAINGHKRPSEDKYFLSLN